MNNAKPTMKGMDLHNAFGSVPEEFTQAILNALERAQNEYPGISKQEAPEKADVSNVDCEQ